MNKVYIMLEDSYIGFLSNILIIIIGDKNCIYKVKMFCIKIVNMK